MCLPQDTKRTQKAFWLAPKSVFWRKNKSNAAKQPGPSGALPNLPASLPPAGGSPNYSPLAYGCPDRSQFAPLRHLEMPDSAGHPREEKDREGQRGQRLIEKRCC